MSKRDTLYHKYREITVRNGSSPIGKRRFNGIVDVLEEIYEIPNSKENTG